MSLKLHNDTPFSAEIFEQLNQSGKLVQCVAVRGTFRIINESLLELSDEQAPFLWTDLYEGEPQDAVLLQQADFIAYKPATDITVIGFTFAPGRVAQSSWMTGVRITDANGRTIVQKLLRVHGPRSWQRVNSDHVGADPRSRATSPTEFFLTSAEPVNRVPLQWQYSAGGQRRDGKESAFDLRNPVGVGLPGWDNDTDQALYPAPLFESVDNPVLDPTRTYEPENLAPIHPAWSVRLRHAGTYDESWKKNRWPLLPQDFDHRFYNCAAPSLVAEPWLEGGEYIELLSLSSRHDKLMFALPAVHMIVHHQSGLNQTFRLDGVHIDTERETVALTWRAAFFASADMSEIFLRIARDEIVDLRPHRNITAEH